MLRISCLLLLLIGTPACLLAQEKALFRTDGATDKTLPWFQLQPGKFPPTGSAHAISGELIAIDHLQRQFHLRVDRNDSQDRGVWDLPLPGTMLPYGAIYYRGAPAALQDIPLGTHLHGLYYRQDLPNTTNIKTGYNFSRSPEKGFHLCFHLADDFSHYAEQKQLWKIESVNLSEKKLTALLQLPNNTFGKPQVFDLLHSTTVHERANVSNLETIQKDQLVLFNLTWATLYGPGRITHIWLDEPSRQLAASQQMRQHRDYQRERGLAGWVESVNDAEKLVTVTFFSGVDPLLFNELTIATIAPNGEPPLKPESKPTAPRGSLAVAHESLQTYDPVNDRKGAEIREIKSIPLEPGNSGVQVQLKCDMLLEGFRPGCVVRYYPAAWKVLALPREEQMFGQE
jgi:hypothetical protein